MNKEMTITILKAAGYTTGAAIHAVELGAIVTDNLKDFQRELPGVKPDMFVYKRKKYYIFYQ